MVNLGARSRTSAAQCCLGHGPLQDGRHRPAPGRPWHAFDHQVVQDRCPCPQKGDRPLGEAAPGRLQAAVAPGWRSSPPSSRAWAPRRRGFPSSAWTRPPQNERLRQDQPACGGSASVAPGCQRHPVAILQRCSGGNCIAGLIAAAAIGPRPMLADGAGRERHQQLPAPAGKAGGGSSALLRGGNRLHDDGLCGCLVGPAGDLHPFAGLEVFVPGEEMLDRLESDFGQILDLRGRSCTADGSCRAARR